MKLIKSTLVLGLVVSGAALAKLNEMDWNIPGSETDIKLIDHIDQVLMSDPESSGASSGRFSSSPIDYIPSDLSVYKNTGQIGHDIAFARLIQKDTGAQGDFRPARLDPVDPEFSADRRIKERSRQMKRDIAFAHAMNADLSIYDKAKQFKRDIAFARQIHKDARAQGDPRRRNR